MCQKVLQIQHPVALRDTDIGEKDPVVIKDPQTIIIHIWPGTLKFEISECAASFLPSDIPLHNLFKYSSRNIYYHFHSLLACSVRQLQFDKAASSFL